MFLLDTNVLSEVLRPRPNLSVARLLHTTAPELRFASELTRYELRMGARLRDDADAFWARIEQQIVPLVQWLPIDAAVALAGADLAAALRRAGLPLEWTDLMVGATAQVHGLTMVTRNVRHFERVPGIAIENWFATA